jgi:hypothetical protein
VGISWIGTSGSYTDPDFYPLNFEVQNAYGQDHNIKKFTYNQEELNRNCEISIDEQLMELQTNKFHKFLLEYFRVM